MRSLLAFSAAAMLVIPEMALAQSAGSMGVDVMGTGHLTVGSHTELGKSDENRHGYDLDSDEVQSRSPPRVEGPDVRFH